jgi:hypothetical protein
MCRYYSVYREANNTFQVCPVCYWEDDEVQLQNTGYEGGAHMVSLNQAKILKSMVQYKTGLKPTLGLL